MPAKLTIEYVKQVCIDNGFEPLFTEYIESHKKLLVRCRICSKTCKIAFNNIQSKKTQSCGQCNTPNIGDKFNRLTIIDVKPNLLGGGGCKVRCKCDCGKQYVPTSFADLISGKVKSCGHCNDPKIGDRFNKLIITKTKQSIKGVSCKVKCLCDCGKETKWYPANEIIKGNTKSCGHCNDPKVGDKFNSLSIIDIKTSKFQGCKVKCLCDCGLKTKWHNISRILSGHIKSCGNCELKRNGILTSHQALKLHNIVEYILCSKCEHNKKIDKYYMDIVNEEYRIVIEYDGFYYHRIHNNTTEKEKSIDKVLKQKGYKFLRIRSSGYDIPTEKQLRKVLLNDFQHGSKKKTITMKSWIKKLKENRN